MITKFQKVLQNKEDLAKSSEKIISEGLCILARVIAHSFRESHSVCSNVPSDLCEK